MKYMKMLGLAVVAAMAMTAIAGVDLASSTVLCKVNTNPCAAEEDYPAGTEIVAGKEAGTSVFFRETSGTILNTCTGSTLKGEVTGAGGETETVTGGIETLTFTGCTTAVATLAGGEFEIHYVSAPNNTRGTMTVKETRLTLTLLGATCVYSAGTGADVGTVTGKTPTTNATIHSFTRLVKVEGSALCPGDIIWDGVFNVTAPAPLYVKPE